MIDRRAFIFASATMAVQSFTFRGASAQDRPVPPTPDEVFRDPDIPVLGNVDGDATIVTFFDYNCPYCKANYPVLTDVVERDGRVRLIMKDWPLLSDASLYVSRLVLASAGTTDYATGLNAIMETRGFVTEDEIDEKLRAAGLDVGVMRERYERSSGRIDVIFDRHRDQARGLRIRGTPGYVIGRRVIAGSYDAAGFEEAIKGVRESGEPH